MPQGNTKHEVGSIYTNMVGKSFREVMDEARRAAANIDINPGTINPDNGQFTLRASIDDQDSFTLSRRSATGHEQVCSFGRSPSHQTGVTNNALGFQAAEQPPRGASPDELLIMTSAGQLVARVRLLVPTDKFHELLAPDGSDSTTSPLRIVSAVTGPCTVFNPAPGIPIVALQSLASHPSETTFHTSPQTTPTPAPRRKPKPDKEKDWSKAVVKPEGATKLETDFCLTCIQNNRDCGGTDLVLVRGEFRCKKCSEKDSTTGTRRCFWKDPAKKVFTYQEARAAAGYKPVYGNTRAGIAARKARKEREAREAREAGAMHQAKVEEDEREDQEETYVEEEEEEDDDDGDGIAFNSAVDAAWQRLYDIAVATPGLDLNDDVTNVNMLGMMRVMLATNQDQWHFDVDIVGAIESRLNERTEQLEATIRRVIDVETPLTLTEARRDHIDTAAPGAAVDMNQQEFETAHGSAGQDSQSASETDCDAEDDDAEGDDAEDDLTPDYSSTKHTNEVNGFTTQ